METLLNQLIAIGSVSGGKREYLRVMGQLSANIWYGYRISQNNKHGKGEIGHLGYLNHIDEGLDQSYGVVEDAI